MKADDAVLLISRRDLDRIKREADAYYRLWQACRKELDRQHVPLFEAIPVVMTQAQQKRAERVVH